MCLLACLSMFSQSICLLVQSTFPLLRQMNQLPCISWCAVPIHGHIDTTCTEHRWVRYICHGTSLTSLNPFSCLYSQSINVSHLPDMTWSVKDINKFIQHPLIHSLMTYDTQYNNREIEYIEHNYSSDANSL